jgi:hypothetical protein
VHSALVDQRLAVAAHADGGRGRHVVAVEDLAEVDELPAADGVDELLGRLLGLGGGDLTGGRVDRGRWRAGCRSVPLGDELLGEGPVVAAVFHERPEGELGVRLVLLQRWHRGGEHLEPVVGGVAGGGADVAARVVAGPHPVPLAVAVGVLVVPAERFEQVCPVGGGFPPVTGAFAAVVVGPKGDPAGRSGWGISSSSSSTSLAP